MVESHKVMVVSYGTFSCRLEGFDDSLETMKAVVEYFHDLGGHDRFMDMEPEVPEVDRLQDIAEEFSSEPVDVEADDGRISLRVKKDTDAAPKVEERIPLRKLAPVEESFDDEADFDDAADDERAPEEAAEADFEDDASITDKLQRIRAVAGQAPKTPAADSYEEDITDADEPSATPESTAALLKSTVKAVENDGFAADEFDDFAEDDEQAFADEEIADEEPLQEDLDAAEAADAAPEDVTFRRKSLDGATDATADLDDADAVDDDDNLSEAQTAKSKEARKDDFDLHQEVEKIDRVLSMRRAVKNSRRDVLPDNDDQEMDRILSQADEHLKAPENKSRRDAIAQMKAAVGARDAERQDGTGNGAKKAEEEFRADLDEVVHTSDDAPALRKEAPAAAPLKLVPSLRVTDEPASAPTGGTADRLRQIAAKADADDDDDDDFVSFVGEVGAEDLIDLIEAAAAYIAFVDGEEDFSRPQVMKKAQHASAEGITREDGLRSFGKLLRQGRINKLPNGRFQIAEDTQFRPVDRAAQG